MKVAVTKSWPKSRKRLERKTYLIGEHALSQTKDERTEQARMTQKSPWEAFTLLGEKNKSQMFLVMGSTVHRASQWQTTGSPLSHTSSFQSHLHPNHQIISLSLIRGILPIWLKIFKKWSLPMITWVDQCHHKDLCNRKRSESEKDVKVLFHCICRNSDKL